MLRTTTIAVARQKLQLEEVHPYADGAAPQGMHHPQHRLHAAVLVATGHRPVRLDATVDRELAGIDLRVTVQQNIPQEPESASTDMFNLKKLHDRVLLLCRAWTKMIAITGPK